MSDLVRAVDALDADRRVEGRAQEGEMDREELLGRRDVAQAERVDKEAGRLPGRGESQQER